MAPWLSNRVSTDSGSSMTSSSDGTSSAMTSDLFEPIAIIGMACRWPGDSESGKDIETPSALWNFLQQKKDAYSDFPPSRVNIDSWYHPVTNRPGSFYTRGGAFLKADPREIDPTFFGINPQEAMSLDPAQRKFLEVVYEALESSGTPLEKVSGSRTGCFVGNFNYDHQLMQYRDTEYPEPYGITGGGIALLSNRVSYVFNLQGPSMTLDTACSSSMYALHLACSAIQSRECNAAIVGGSNLILTPECQVFSSALGAVSKSSKCHTFDAAADGYARADGIGALYVKSLRQAILDEDPIRAIIRGTAINANGKTGGITHPDPDGQEKAIRRAYQRAGIDPALTTYFECHGTGTPVGDPLEVEAVARVFADSKTSERPLLIGSIKSNMGHCESASGIAGIMKTVLALERGVIPPIRSLRKLNPNVDLNGGKLKIVQESTVWPTEDVHRASVNSFGYGGANAHTILESIDSLAPGHAGMRAREFLPTSEEHASGVSDRVEVPRIRHFLLPFSAHNERTLKRNVDALQPLVDRWHLIDIAYTLSCRRSTLSTRSFVVAEEGQVHEALQSDKLMTYKALGSQKLSLGFVFTGQGAQWPQMGLELMESFPTYLRSIREMDDILRSIKGGPRWDLEASLRAAPESSQVYRAELSQALVTAVQVALVDLLASWDIQPSVTVGHSSGEIAAAYASGRISAAEAIITAYARGQAVSRNQMKGAMLALGTGADTIAQHLKKFNSISVACYNSPESTTLSGDYEDIVTLKSSLDAESKFARILATDGNAYHSTHMKKLGAGYEDELNRLLSSLSSILGHNTLGQATFVSSVTGKVYGKQPINAQYWRNNLESPVLFTQALTDLVQTHSVDCLLEIGPHSALLGPIRQISKSMSHLKFPEYIPTLIRHGDGAKNLLTLAGTLFAKGHKLNLKRINSVEALDSVTNSILDYNSGDVIVDLPKYQWYYSDQFYFENRWTREWRLRTHPRHDLLGSRSPGGNWKEPVWRNVLKQKDLPWLQDHKIGSDVVFPTSAYLALAIEAATQMVEISRKDSAMIQKYELHNVHLEAALIIPENGGTELLTSLRSTKLNNKTYYASMYDFTITSVVKSGDNDVFTEHASGQITMPSSAQDEGPPKSLESPVCRKHISSSQWYDAFKRVGLNYGPTFQGLSDIMMRSQSCLAQSRVNMFPTVNVMSQESRYVIHPAALDSTLQLAILAAHDGRASKCETGFLPVSIERMTLWPSGQADLMALASAHARISSPSELTADIALALADGKQMLTGSKIVLVASETIPPSSMESLSPFTRMTWRPDVSLLTTPALEMLYPSTFRDNENAELSSLDLLALYQTVQFKAKHPEFFAEGSSVPHLQRLLSWMTQKVDLATCGHFSDGVKIVNFSIDERDAEIRRLTANLMDKNGPETRLMCHMYESLPAIYRGEITGIHAAVQDHLLDNMYAHMSLYHDGTMALKDLVVLLSHKNPKLKILEVGGGTGSATREVLPALRGHTQYRGYDSYTFTDIGTGFLAAAQGNFKDHKGVVYSPFDMQVDVAEQGYGSDYDLIIASNVIHATTNIQGTLKNIRRLLKPGGKLVLFEFVQSRLFWNMILGTFSDFWNGDFDPMFSRTEGPFLTQDIWRRVLPRAGFGGINIMLDYFAQQGEAAIIMATAAELAPLAPSMPQSKSVSIVHRGDPSAFVLDFGHFLQSSGATVQLIPLSQSNKLEGGRCVLLVEVDQPLFPNITFEEWENLKSVLLTSHSALYVTRGGLLDGGNPENGMMSGLVCAIHTEIQSSRLVTVNLDQDLSYQEQDFANLIRLEERAAAYAPGDDFEYRSKSGVLYVSRLESDDPLNANQHCTAHDTANSTSVPLARHRQNAMIMSIKQVGGSRTVQFEEDAMFLKELEQDEIEIEVMAADLGDKLTGNPTNRSGKSQLFTGGCAGVVTRVGSVVTCFKPGATVFGIYSSALGTLVRTKERLCIDMREQDTYKEMATIPTAFCSAIYGLTELGRLAKGETILIQSPASSIGLAACQIARICGAEVYVTAEPGEEHFLQVNLGIQEDHVICSGDGITTEKLLQYTNGAGFNVILSSAHGEEMHQYWGSVAHYGRFIDLGRTEAFENGRLSMKTFQQNATFSSFDIQSLTSYRPAVVASMIQKIRTMLLEGNITPLPRKAFSVSDINDAFNETTKAGCDGAVLTLRPSTDKINVRKVPSELTFSPEASYILVGCFGGLGRSFTEWMVSRGARKLTFLSRTGAVGQEAQDLLFKLQNMAIDVQVIKGDVTSMEDVEYAIKSCTGPIKGIVQAALTLHDSFFSEMTLDDFKATMDPRVKGTLNLHRALEKTPLDFFLMWSSWTTIFGSASQSNYMAANSFMDAFAHYRRSQGLPATSLGLGQILDVGIVSYHPQYQENLLRMGLYGNTEDDFLRYCETAIRISSTPPRDGGRTGLVNEGHLLAGVEPAGLLAKDNKYPIKDMSWHRDPRFSLLVQATTHLASEGDHPAGDGAADHSDDADQSPLVRIHRKLALLLYVPREDIDVGLPIKSYGIDSMVAAELRNWLFGAFGVDVSLLKLLHPGMTAEKLADEVGGARGEVKE